MSIMHMEMNVFLDEQIYIICCRLEHLFIISRLKIVFSLQYLQKICTKLNKYV